MRVLFTTLPASGHWHPLVPFAALRAAGHEVAFATASERCAAIAALGFRCFPAGTEETAEEAQERRTGWRSSERRAPPGSAQPLRRDLGRAAPP